MCHPTLQTAPSAEKQVPDSADTLHPQTVHQNEPSSTTSPIVMATQTEWDLWGSPLSAGKSFLSPSRSSTQCSCEYNVRLLLDWKRDSEKRAEVNREQDRARTNYLRERLIRAEEDREKMRATINNLSKQAAVNASMIADVLKRGIDVGSYDYGARVFTCQSGNSSSFDPTSVGNPSRFDPTSAYTPNPTPPSSGVEVIRSQANGGSAPASQRVVAGRGDPSMSRPPTTNSGANPRVPSAPQLAPLPQRDRGKADRSSDPRGQGYGPVSNSAPPTNRPDRSVIPPSRPAQQNTQPSGNGNTRQPNSVSTDAWADDHVTDAELMCVSVNGVPYMTSQRPGSSVAAPMPVNPPSTGGAARAAVSVPNQNVSVDANRKGEKRTNDGHPDESAGHDSYAEAAKYKWNEVENKRMRRNNSDDGMTLLGVKSTPHKEIFVKHLDYSRCSKPAELEGRVKLYCRRRGIFILQARVFEQSDCNRANCRVSLKIEDVDKALSQGFWPEHAVARIWSANPQQDAANMIDDGDDGAFGI